MTVDELLAVAAQFAAERFRQATRVRIDFADGLPFEASVMAGQPVLPVPAATEAQPTVLQEAVEGVDPELYEAILQHIDGAFRRFTREEMSAAMPEHGESTVHKALWLMKKAGKLSNTKDGFGAGYGQPDWK